MWVITPHKSCPASSLDYLGGFHSAPSSSKRTLTAASGNCPDVENNLYMSAVIQVTVHIFGVPFKTASITTYVMQHPIAFTQEMEDKDEFKAFALKWNASKNSMRALEFTERQKDMLPTH